MPIDVYEPEKQKTKKKWTLKKPIMITKRPFFFNLVVEILILDEP